MGYGFYDEPAGKSVDLEALILDTCKEINKEPRLFWGALTWVIANGSLINVSRLIALLQGLEETSRIGFLFDTALQNKADKKLKSILPYCKKKKKAELFFDLPARFKYLEPEIRREALATGKKWGYYINSFFFFYLM